MTTQVVLKPLFDEAHGGLPKGELKDQAMAFLRQLEGMVNTFPRLFPNLHGLRKTVPRLAALSKILYGDSPAQQANRPAQQHTGSRLMDLPDDVRGLIYEHVSASNLARAKAVNKASKKFLNDFVPRQLAKDGATKGGTGRQVSGND